MPKRKTKPSKKKKQDSKAANSIESGLKRSVLKEVLAIVLITVGVFIILALIGVAGSLGRWVLESLRLLIGQSIILLPLALFWVSFMLFAQERYPIRLHNILGLISLFICSSTIIQAIIAPEVSLDLSTIGNYGGLVGYGVYSLVSPILTRWVVIFIFSMLMIISVIVSLNARLKQIAAKIVSPLRKPKDDTADLDTKSFKINTSLPVRGTIGDAKAREAEKSPSGPIVMASDADWKYPSLDLLESSTSQPDPGDAKKNGAIIKSTFLDFGYKVDMQGVDVGPTVSQYTLKPPGGVNLSRFSSLDRNLALALEAEHVRIEAPIPGKSLVGVEVPNKTRAKVRLRDILDSPQLSATKGKLNFVLGRDVSGEIITSDLDKAPHLLIAGSTKTGKSVMIHSLLISLLYRNSPSELKLILVDPTRADFSLYDNLPHLLCPVINDPEPTISALKWTVAEMERRLKLLQENQVLNIDEFNKLKTTDKMPYIVIIIDELAGLMLKAKKDMESLISSLAAMARKAGIHLVLATQTPRVEVITGTIKNNLPTRIAFTVPQYNDSKTIIDTSGAEKLLGNGDMLFMSPSSFIKPKRAQGVLIEKDEVTKVVKFLKAQREPQYNDEVLAQSVRIKGLSSAGGFGPSDGDDDELFDQAAELVIESGKASSTMLQTRFRIGFARAARLISQLEEKSIIGPADGARPRAVLVDSMEQVNGGESDPK